MTALIAALLCAATTAGDPAYDLVYLQADQPVFLRVRFRLGDAPQQNAWREVMAHLFRNLDVDENGVVTAQELNRGNWPERMKAGSGPAPTRRGATPAPAAASVPAVRNADELARALRAFVPPVAFQRLAKQDDGSENLFEKLDRDGDRRLSQSELDAAADVLAPFDADDDQTIRASELLGYRNRFIGRAAPQPGPVDAEAVPLALVGPDEPRARLASRLIQRYDVGSRENPREKDHKLARFELALDADVFRRADADADGALDALELTRFLEQPAPDVDVTITLGKDAKAKPVIEAANRGTPNPFLTRGLRRPSSGRFDLCDDRTQVEFFPAPAPGRPGFDIREFYKNQFAAADRNADKAVDKDESNRNNLLSSNFDVMDRDADGKLREDELVAFVDQQLEIAERRVLLLITDAGHALFEALDVNRDRRLGARELRTALRRLSAWDLDGDGRLGREEVPRHFRLTVDRALPALLIQVGRDPFDDDSETPVAGGDVPRWFSKMDANHDGDLSAREFLGATSDFRRLDRDADGLIDPNEAARTP
jgi:Ca2+-binding EF-hand superfamily protein